MQVSAPMPLLPLAVIIALVSRLAVVQGAASETAIVYIGSGGCDIAIDPQCTDDAKAEHVMRAIELKQDGSMTPRPDLAVEIGGMPVWIATEGAGKRCLFVTRADTDELLAFVADASGKLKGPVSTVKSGGRTPVFAAATQDGKILLVANYNAPDDTNTSNGAAASSFHIHDDCKLDLAHTVEHKGSSVDPQRQGGAHVHSFVPVRGGLAYACDLGMDMIFAYNVSPDGRLTELNRKMTKPGLGPRHLLQHPILDVLYVVTEMGEAVLIYEQLGDGSLELIGTESLVPTGGLLEGSKAAEIEILPDGSAVYATNRGQLDSVTVFDVLQGGLLKQRQRVAAPLAPGIPRGMTLAFDGTLLLAASQQTSVVLSYSVSKGMLSPTGFNITSDVPPKPAAFAVLPVSSMASIV